MPIVKEAALKYVPVADDLVLGEFGDLVSALPEVEAVLANYEHGVMQTWTVVNELPDITESRIYALEGELMDRFPDAGLDFHIIERRGRPLNEIVSLDLFSAYWLREEN